MRPIKIFSAICLIVMTAIFSNSCSKSDTGSGAPTAQNVSITSMAFSPATVTVVVGTNVTWTNTDAVPHTVTSDDGTSFNSGSISPAASYTFTVTTAGSYPYHCSLHPTMTGMLQVVIR